MKELWALVATGSLKELVKYKSFLLLVLFLFALDKGLKALFPLDKSALALPDVKAALRDLEAGLPQIAHYIFEEMPGQLIDFLLLPSTWGIGLGLFFLKQLISLWPSSDMRRMHRHEREAFGLIHSLLVLRWGQVAWDGLAVIWVVSVSLAWAVASYFISLFVWGQEAHLLGLALLGVLSAGLAPLIMAAFSFSSKLAVLSHGSFGAKFKLYLYLFTSPRYFGVCYLFFSLRVVLEVIFVLLIPMGLLLFVESTWVKFSLSALSATPVYGFLKMASFKFFLWAYRHEKLVQGEYAHYYADPEDI